MSVFFSLDAVYVLAGIVLAIFAALTFADRDNPRRIGSGFFWLILATICALGSAFPYWVTGLLVLAMVVIDGVGFVTRGKVQSNASAPEHALRLGNRIFIPVLTVPAVTFVFATIFQRLQLDVTRGTLVGLAFGGCAAMALAMKITGGTAREMLDAGRRLNETMGAVSILPQLLASLGVIFTAAKVGDIIARGIQHIIPGDSLFLLVAANCLGMTLFTIVMGNSFAAFPVIASGVFVPLIVKPLGADPAMVAIITLTAGSSGTLITPMAANFNIVPAALLDLRSPYGVIKFQLPFAVTIWTFHVLLLWSLIRLST
jgi:uncharacterized membrane protein